MEKRMRAWVCGLGLMVWGVTGCNDDLYAPCEFAQTDRQAQVCGAENAKYSCAIENSLQCETRVCARYEGSDGFCTKKCSADADCGELGTCREFVFQSGNKYCVEIAKTE
jgi:hypothetical protein